MSSTRSQLEVPTYIPTLTTVASLPSYTDEIYHCETYDCLQLHLGHTTSELSHLFSRRSRNEDAFTTSRFCPEGYDAECGHTIYEESGTTSTCYPSSPTCRPGSDLSSDSSNIYEQSIPPSGTQVYTLSTSPVQLETSTSSGSRATAIGITVEEMHDAVSTLDSQASHSTVLATRDIERQTNYGRRKSSAAGIVLIVVLSIIFVLGVGALSLYCHRRRKRRKGASTDAEALVQANADDPSKSPGMAETGTSELDGQPIVEASSAAVVPIELHELDGQSHPVELAAEAVEVGE